MYEIRAHTADLEIHVEAASLEQLLAESGTALFASIVENVESVRSVKSVDFRISGCQPEYLLLDWLSELLFAFEKEHLLLREFQVTVDQAGLSGSAQGEPYDVHRHHLQHEVKAITYHGLLVSQTNSGWTADFIIDI